jgi:hypothetical protein
MADDRPKPQQDTTSPLYSPFTALSANLDRLSDRARRANTSKMATTPSGPGGNFTRLALWAKANLEDKAKFEKFWKSQDQKKFDAAKVQQEALAAQRDRVKQGVAAIQSMAGGLNGNNQK